MVNPPCIHALQLAYMMQVRFVVQSSVQCRHELNIPQGLAISRPCHAAVCCPPCSAPRGIKVSCPAGPQAMYTSYRLVLQDYSERRALRAELKALQKEERRRQQRAVDEVLKVGCA